MWKGAQTYHESHRHLDANALSDSCENIYKRGNETRIETFQSKYCMLKTLYSKNLPQPALKLYS